jgi:hypothetical protein
MSVLRGSRRRIAVIATVLLLAACSRSDGGSDSTEAPPLGTAATSPSVDVSADPLEGDWSTGETTCEQQESALDRAGFSSSEIRRGVGFLCQYFSFEIRFLDGQLVIFEDGEIGWDGYYTLIDENSFVATDIPGGDGYITYRFVIDGKALTVDMVKDECPSSECTNESELRGEVAAQTRIYESAPFERVD